MTRLWGAIFVAACSSSAPVTVRPAPARANPAATVAAKLPAAEALSAGTAISKTIRVGESHWYQIDAGPSMVVSGAVIQKGIDVAVHTYDSSGKHLQEIDSPNGTTGPEPFVIETTAPGPYRIEVRTFTEPSPDGPPTLAGDYEVRVDQVQSADSYAEQLARNEIESERVLKVWSAARIHDQAALDRYWTELKGKTPIVEPYAGDKDSRLITFIMRSPHPYVGLLRGPAGVGEAGMRRIGDSDFWYATARIPAESHFDYAFIETSGPPPLHVPYRPLEEGDRRFKLRITDPNNPTQHMGMSRVDIPAAPAAPWLTDDPSTQKGTVSTMQLSSAVLGEKRLVGVYLPAGYDTKERYPLIIAFDGEAYGLEAPALVPLPQILDNLIAAKKIRPVVAALVANQNTRVRDLVASPPFASFVVDELVPKMRDKYHAGLSARDTVVTGSSLGGTEALYIGLQHSRSVGNVLTNSAAALWMRPHQFDADVSDYVEGSELIHDYAKTLKLPLRFYMDAGIFEGTLRDSNRHLRDVLTAKGYDVTYAEFAGGHDSEMWRVTIPSGLIALLGRR